MPNLFGEFKPEPFHAGQKHSRQDFNGMKPGTELGLQLSNPSFTDRVRSTDLRWSAGT